MSDSFEPKREYTYIFKIWCAEDGNPDLLQVENLLDLSMQELTEDEGFAAALDETTAFTIQILDANVGKKG